MAIIRKSQIESTEEQKEGTLVLEFNNGDFQALSDTVKRLGFKDEESMLRFALAVLKQSATRSLSVTDTSGKAVSFNPSSTLLKSETTVDESI